MRLFTYLLVVQLLVMGALLALAITGQHDLLVQLRTALR